MAVVRYIVRRNEICVRKDCWSVAQLFADTLFLSSVSSSGHELYFGNQVSSCVRVFSFRFLVIYRSIRGQLAKDFPLEQKVCCCDVEKKELLIFYDLTFFSSGKTWFGRFTH